jgi:hypothetical protein
MLRRRRKGRLYCLNKKGEGQARNMQFKQLEVATSARTSESALDMLSASSTVRADVCPPATCDTRLQDRAMVWLWFAASLPAFTLDLILMTFPSFPSTEER